jgi:hypothetical protein
MSALENQVRPILEPLILGIPTLFSINDQILLSTWMTKTAMVLEQAGAGTHRRYFTQAEREAFRSAGQLPGFRAVWIARVNEPQLAGWAHEDEVSFTIEHSAFGLTHVNGYVASLAAGEVALQALFICPPYDIGSDVSIDIPTTAGWETATVRICPSSTSVSWPPMESLTLDRLRGLANRWTKSGAYAR